MLDPTAASHLSGDGGGSGRAGASFVPKEGGGEASPKITQRVYRKACRPNGSPNHNTNFTNGYGKEKVYTVLESEYASMKHQHSIA